MIVKRIGLLVCCGLLWAFAGCASAGDGALSLTDWQSVPLSPELRARAKPHLPKRVTLHHGGVAFPPGTDAVAYLQRLQAWSRGVRGWADIPYHYVIDLDGKVYAARDVLLAGDTNTGYVTSGHALVMLLGNLSEVQPTAAQVESAVRLTAHLIQRFDMPISRLREVIAGHKDVSAGTECPGTHFHALIASGEIAKRVGAQLSLPAP
jgi:N-acetylmuramoyl-L-alanine amidase